MTRARHIVIVDDEANIGRSLRLILEGEGHRVTVFDTAASFMAGRSRAGADLYLLDVRLPDGNGIDLLRSLRQWDERTAAVMISGHGTIADAVEATQDRRVRFLEKPLARDRVLLAMKNALAWSDLQRENQRYRELVGHAPRMIGSAPAFAQAVRAGDAGRAIRRDRPADWASPAPARSSSRRTSIAKARSRSGPFVKVNCAAIPTELIESELFGHEKGAFTGAAALRRGRFELADGGTIFLDEVGDLHEASQAKLLRVLQDGEFQRVGGEQTIRVSRARHLGDEPAISTSSSRRARSARTSTIGSASCRFACRRCASGCRTFPSSWRTSSSEFCARNNFRPRDDRCGRRRRARTLRLAGQRPRIAERRGTDGDPHARRSHHRRARFHSRSGSAGAARGGTAGSARRRRARSDPPGAASRRTGTFPPPRGCWIRNAPRSTNASAPSG